MDKKLGRLLRPSTGMYLLILFGFGVITAISGDYVLAGLQLGVTVLILALHLMYRTRRLNELQAYLQRITDQMTGMSGGAQAPFPTVLFRLADHEIVYVNKAFSELTGFRDTFAGRTVDAFLPDFTTDWMISGNKEYSQDLRLEDKRYRVFGAAYRADDATQTPMGILYLAEMTQLYQVRDEYIRSRPVVSIILVDNYEELIRNMSEAAVSVLDARINKTLLKWAKQYHGLLRRLEKNRFLLLLEKRDLQQAIEGKFSVLEDIHDITAPSGVNASISFGLGVDGATFEEGYEFAALSIEMALSRGGDQAVVKDRLNFRFFGGRSAEADHRGKVRSRVTANSMMELIGQSSQVFIMGHKLADLDSVGAAMGIGCLCRKKGKPFYIVLDLQNNASEKLIEEIRAVPEYKKVFISGEDALLMCDNRSTLVVVDTNRPDQVEFKPLLEAVPKICVVDHHRRAADYIKPVVNFHEPYASSAAELTTELLEYAVEKRDVLPIEAKSLMAGIFLDTKSFHVRTGERTFEAAAYLRQLGADTVEVKKLLQNDFHETLAKNKIIKGARPYHGDVAISVLSNVVTRALAAQAADELLNIEGFNASFVLFPDGENVIICARSIGQANVQVILEPLGGGGNAATAGAQIANSTVKDVLDQLLASIDQYYES